MAKRNRVTGWRFSTTKDEQNWVVSDTEYTMEHTGKHRVAAICFSSEEASAIASLMNKDTESARRTIAGFLDKWSASWD